MKSAGLFVLTVLHTVASVTAVTVTTGSVTNYDPAELLTKIFNLSTTGESRQRGYGFIKFDDQFDPEAEDNQATGQYGLVETGQRPLKFEDDFEQNYSPDIESQNSGAVKFQDSENDLSLNGGVTFLDDNKVNDQGNKKKRKRRRRRKPKSGVMPYPGAVRIPPGIPGPDGRPEMGFQGPYEGYGQGYLYGRPGYPIQPFRRPRRRPKPSLASEALSSITEALTSIARYDDYQCVPRLLCEAAGGGALNSNGVLQSIAGIQPLLTLLSAYNGISTSPLFVFGRAVFLGMTSQGNTGTCRYAYPQCPTDPEQLIYYLNNHNGGFFRFFNAPQSPNQNIEQFYNQLGNQGYGLYQPQQNLLPQNFGYRNDPNSGQIYDSNTYNQNYQHLHPSAYDDQYYGQKPHTHDLSDRPSLYDQNYRPYYAKKYNYGSENQIKFKYSNTRIEKRIQNKPTENFANDYFGDDFEEIKTKWQFPDELENTNVNKNYYKVRDSRTLKFPEDEESYNDYKESTRKGKQIYFPDSKINENYYSNRQQINTNNNRYQTSTYSYNNNQKQQNLYIPRPNTNTNNNIKYHNYNYIPNNNKNKYHTQQNYYNNQQNMYNNNHKYQGTTIFNNEEYVFDHKHNFYVKKENNYSTTSNYPHIYNSNKYSNSYSTNSFKRNEDDGIKTVYVVRGNGDPNRPEIVKLRPGQSVY